jgi:hypothetical protein
MLPLASPKYRALSDLEEFPMLRRPAPALLAATILTAGLIASRPAAGQG